jgi:hypothetical protein
MTTPTDAQRKSKSNICKPTPRYLSTTAKAKDEHREKLEKDIEAFFANGGKVEMLPRVGSNTFDIKCRFGDPTSLHSML